MPIQATRTLLDAALSGELDAVEYRVEPSVRDRGSDRGAGSRLDAPRSARDLGRSGPRTTRRRRSSPRCSGRTSYASTTLSPASRRPALAPSRRRVLTQGSHSHGYKGRVAHPTMRRPPLSSRGAPPRRSRPRAEPRAGAARDVSPRAHRGRDRPAQRDPARPRRDDLPRRSDHDVDGRDRGCPRLRRAPGRDGHTGRLGRVLRPPRPRARARTAAGVHRDDRRGAGDLRHARPRLLCTRPAGRPGRGGLRHVGRRGRQARVRPPRRGAPTERPVGGDRLGAEAMGEHGERVRPGDAEGGVPRRRGLELRGEPRRGMGGGLPADGRAQGRDHDRHVADHRAELLPGRG